MKVIQKLITLILYCALANAQVLNHTCVPAGYSNLCVLRKIQYTFYNPAKHIFPKGYSHVRIVNEAWFYEAESKILELDAELYNNLDRPEALELVDVFLTRAEIPRALKLANFANNHLDRLSVEKGETEAQLTYLDLSRNSLQDLTNVSSLTNLEVVYLSENRISTIDRHVFKDLNKLKILDLNNNYIVALPDDGLPHSLTFLGLYYNSIDELNYNQLALPELESFIIAQNHLTKLNVTALLQAMPKLKFFRLENNELSPPDLMAVTLALEYKNIIYKNSNSRCLHSDSELVEGACVKQTRDRTGKGWLAATGLSLLVMLVGGAFVCIIWRTYRAMNR